MRQRRTWRIQPPTGLFPVSGWTDNPIQNKSSRLSTNATSRLVNVGAQFCCAATRNFDQIYFQPLTDQKIASRKTNNGREVSRTEGEFHFRRQPQFLCAADRWFAFCSQHSEWDRLNHQRPIQNNTSKSHRVIATAKRSLRILRLAQSTFLGLVAILINDFCDQTRAVSRAHRLAFKAKSMPLSASLNAYVLLKQFRTNFFHKINAYLFSLNVESILIRNYSILKISLHIQQ